jgi:hypothetical protein
MNAVLEAEKQLLLWEKKIQLAKVRRSCPALAAVEAGRNTWGRGGGQLPPAMPVLAGCDIISSPLPAGESQETKAELNSNQGAEELRSMQAEVHRMELRLGQLQRQKEELISEVSRMPQAAE